MEPSFIEFVGAPCGQHGPYTFYKAFRYRCDGKQRILSLGEFFYVKIDEDASVCLGEVQLLWEDKNQEGQLLSSIRLYFLPENTPEGRQIHHGEDEVVAEQEKFVLRIEDLISWIVEGVSWLEGSQPFCDKSDQAADNYDGLVQAFTNNNPALQLNDVQKEKKESGLDDHQFSCVRIMSFAQYCRYRTMQRRLEGVEDVWLRNALVCALGGVKVLSPDVRLLFCCDTTLHPDLEDHPFRQDHLTPNLKGRPRKRKLSFKKEGSVDSDSNGSDDWSYQTPVKKRMDANGLLSHLSMRKSKEPCPLLPPGHGKVPPHEESFLRRLHNFMQDRGTPIGRVPTLGFKEGKKSPVDLYYFYSYTQKLGGYESVTNKRLWKHIYDRLGGNPSNTSAATCTRRHFERLLLSFERHMRGEDEKPLPEPYRKPRRWSRPDSPSDKDGDGDVDSPVSTRSVTPTIMPLGIVTTSGMRPAELPVKSEKSELTMAQKERLWAEKRWQSQRIAARAAAATASATASLSANKVPMTAEPVKPSMVASSGSMLPTPSRKLPSPILRGNQFGTKHKPSIPPPNVTMNVKQQAGSQQFDTASRSTRATATGTAVLPSMLTPAAVKQESLPDCLKHSIASMVHPPVMPLFVPTTLGNGIKTDMLIPSAYGLMAVDGRTGMLYPAEAAGKAGVAGSAVQRLSVGAGSLSRQLGAISPSQLWKTGEDSSRRPSVIQHTSPHSGRITPARPAPPRSVYGPPHMMMQPPPRMPVPSPVQPQYLIHADRHSVALPKPPAAHSQSSRRSYPQNLLGLPDSRTSPPCLPPALSAGQEQPTDLSVGKPKNNKPENTTVEKAQKAPVIDLTCYEPMNLVLDSKSVSETVSRHTSGLLAGSAALSSFMHPALSSHQSSQLTATTASSHKPLMASFTTGQVNLSPAHAKQSPTHLSAKGQAPPVGIVHPAVMGTLR